eukprot:m.7105 g.7105  ORF g.7105 m.7105 type:complete len:205 (+) comp5655_c0_seq1:72-686(+)
MTDSKIVLRYFDIAGRGEPIRIAFHAGNIDFEDQRISFKDYPEVKKTLVLGYLPELVVDGVVFTQYAAMVRYAGRLSNLYPIDPIKQLQADEIIEIAQELLYKAPKSDDEEEKKALREKFAATTLKKTFEYVESRIKRFGDKYIAGEDFTIADLTFIGIVRMIETGNYDYIPKEYLNDFDVLLAWYKRAQSHDVNTSYYASKEQ